MLDLELLHTLVCVVDEGSFTRAAERVHRTQSTVSQQIRKLEDSVGQVLLVRDRSGQQVSATEHGQLLTQYARRLLNLSREAREALNTEASVVPVRLGVPEDFDATRMASMLSGFVRARPEARLETVSGMSSDLRRQLDSGEIDIALVKREAGSGECHASWPEPLVWVCGHDQDVHAETLPLALFPQGCIYRQRAIRTLDKARRSWRVAFGSHSLTGIQAAVTSGLGVSILPNNAVLPSHRICSELPPVLPSELALVSGAQRLSATHRGLIECLREEISRTL
ncbi:LysR family transcriptional regulator [Pseudomonas extremorientalis]|uniref:DNA-binding transcriptional regulator, LysR family n=1 Tax=Pseudomonas extremorientalis TaxID=169669 RepID=A0A1H0J1F2_9PSED|nr:LysR family transcriptional regulator [Pseudomonas extremorientalis]KAB0510851.1 LysR family transcriptional regulator [Pseudomonas extremorientalis]OIN12604.1 LysR family transcriptional regulator [Pseudomonas extremorientalis]WLG59566.1 LysR family transcriptional regulator [Pseudomonas extremorientalis]SDO37535.1 DNA-binding transcriptional regulator, LysR family [Pseudomonas extremorientalis]